MSEADTQGLFSEAYYRSHCGERAYQHDEVWYNFFDIVAERIVADIQPKTVLDAGCAYGILVERLRSRGVEAWGIDISEYAISQVAPAVRDFCRVGSILDPLPATYDLIVSIEVVEHLPEADSMRAIENLCRHSNDILLSSTPYDYKEPTHFNVQPPEYWARQFARHSFYRDLEFDGSFITPWAARFRRLAGPVPEVIQNYERVMWRMKNELSELRGLAVEQHRLLKEHEARWAELETGDTWKMVEKIQGLRLRFIPVGSRRERWLRKIRGK